jgi:hypothetical protein
LRLVVFADFFFVAFLAVRLVAFLTDFFTVFFFPAFLGTFFPAARASDKPIAMACFRLVTFFFDRPLFSVPALRFFTARSTFAEAALEYFRAMLDLPDTGQDNLPHPAWFPTVKLVQSPARRR